MVKVGAKGTFENFLDSCEQLIRLGRHGEARKQMSLIRAKEVPQAHLARMAQLLSRVGYFDFGLMLLSPVVRPTENQPVTATALEKATYANLLTRVGSAREAIQLLDEIREPLAEVSLYKGFAHISKWEYSEAIPFLRRYLEFKEPTEYQRAVAQVNLLSALIVEQQLTEAENLARDLFRRARENRWTLLFKNLQELSAQAAAQAGKWDDVIRELVSAGRERYQDVGQADFLVRKWLAIGELYKSGAPHAINMVRAEANEKGHWETVRDCDYHVALRTQNQALFLQVYFGTPYASHRARMMDKVRDWVTVPDEYDWCVLSEPKLRVFDLHMASEVDNPDVNLKPGQVMHLGLQALLSDFYKPLFIGELHAKMFPGTYYNPVSSPARVANVVRRLRVWVADAKIPILIQNNSSRFQLLCQGAYAFRLRRESLAVDGQPGSSNVVYIEKLSHLIDRNEPFTSNEVQTALGLSKSSGVRLLNWAIENGHLERFGSHKATRYRFLKVAK